MGTTADFVYEGFPFLPGGSIPQKHLGTDRDAPIPNQVACEDRFAIWTKIYTPDEVLAPRNFKRADLFSRLRVPFTDPIVQCCRSDLFSIGAEEDLHGSFVPNKDTFEFSGFNVPEPDRAVKTATGDCAAVRTEAEVHDRCEVSDEGRFEFAGLGIPEPNRGVKTTRSNRLSVRTELHGFHVVWVSP